MGVILPFFVILNVIVSNGHLLPWHNVPIQDVVEVEEKETIQNIYETETLKDVLEFEPINVPEVHERQLEITYAAGQNCGKEGTAETIYINKVNLPDVILLGGNATFSAGVTVNKVRKTATLLSVVLQKVGLPFDIPCTNNIGSCNYTNPCDLLAKIECPKEIISQGWNCRCPILKNKYAFGPVTVTLPTVPLPAFLVDGKYNGKVQLFDGADELLCYQLEVTVKEK